MAHVVVRPALSEGRGTPLRPADQHAAAVIPSQLDELRRKERLRELYRQHLHAPGTDGLSNLAATIGPEVGLDEHTALAWLQEFASAN